jgi:cytochrome P450/NADPH-cytochrome P450 reductase
MYVQDILWADRVEVVHLWNQGAKVYVCGGINMTDGVKNSPRSVNSSAETDGRPDAGSLDTLLS